MTPDAVLEQLSIHSDHRSHMACCMASYAKECEATIARLREALELVQDYCVDGSLFETKILGIVNAALAAQPTGEARGDIELRRIDDALETIITLENYETRVDAVEAVVAIARAARPQPDDTEE
jgi:hypothetical protein